MSTLEKVQSLVRDEIARAVHLHGEHYATDHEAYAVLLEEVDEVKAWVWKKRRERDREAMVRELVQVAATAQKWAASLMEGVPGPRAPGLLQAVSEIRAAARNAGDGIEGYHYTPRDLQELADHIEELAKS